jgi:predicted Ser/Thr protein kinase
METRASYRRHARSIDGCELRHMMENTPRLLKKDIFGEVWLDQGGGITRNAGAARAWCRPFARWLLAREAKALAALDGIENIPAIRSVSADSLEREYIEGLPMQLAKPTDPAYFRDALRLLRRLHRSAVVHNDLAKEPNWIVTKEGGPALIDFQLAAFLPRRGRWFRVLAREDIRHLLKHKRTYCPDRLTARQRRLLADPSGPSRIWMGVFKPIYLVVTRRLLGWADREGAHERSES